MPPRTTPARAQRASWLRPGTRGAALLGVLTTTCLLAVPAAASAAGGSVVTPQTPVAYTEQAAPVLLGEDIAVSGGSAYGGGYIDVAVDGATSADVLSVVTSTVADTTAGSVSIVGDTVYIGNGSAAEVIGSIDPSRAGADGRLRIMFTSPFANPSFEDSDQIVGWTAITDRIDLGVTSIAGFRTIDRSTYTGLNSGQPDAPTNDDDAPANATYNVLLNTREASDGGRSLELSSTMTTAGSCDVVHGPAVYSDPFEAAAGDKIYFDWRAFEGHDNYHVFGYILDTVTGAQTTVLDATGDDSTAPAFQTKETSIPVSGTYRFVFVGGTHDLTCGQAAGARLLIDNVRVYGSKVTDQVVTSLGRKLQYANTSDDPAAQRTVTITVADREGSTIASGDVDVEVTPVDDPPTLDPVAAISLLNAEGPDQYPNTAGQLVANDPDSDQISYRIDGDRAEDAVVDGQSYTHAVTGRYGTLRVDEGSGRYVFVPDAAAADARRYDDAEDFTFSASSTDERSVRPLAALAAPVVHTVRQQLDVTLDVVAGAPGAPTEVAAEAGAESASLSWEAPDWIGGSDVTGYRVEQSLDGGDTWTVVVADTASTATEYEVTGLPAGTPALFRVSAINANGTGPSAASDDAVTAYTTPGAPSISSILPSNGTLTVLFTPSEDDGGSEVTDYEYSLDGGETWVSAGTASSPVTITGLRNGVAYDLLLRAVNAAGGGEAVQGAAVPALAPVSYLDEDGTPVLPIQRGGAAAGTRGGAPIAVDSSTDGGEVRLAGEGFDVRVSSADPDGRLVALRDGVIEAVQGGSLHVTGEGYQPGSTVDLWLLRSNVLLGQVVVGADGTFSVVVPVPASVSPRADTLQINGIDPSGQVRSLALGLVIVEPDDATLANTGGTWAFGVVGAGAALLAGGALLLVRRRRASLSVERG